MTRCFGLRLASFLLPWLVLLMGSGCGGKRVGSITGKVSCQGKPVVMGTVSAIASDNIQYTATITPEGTYTIPNVPAGAVKLGVSSPNPDASARGGPAVEASLEDAARATAAGAPQAAGAWVEVPQKYSDPLSSGLTGNVRSATTINLDLE